MKKKLSEILDNFNNSPKSIILICILCALSILFVCGGSLFFFFGYLEEARGIPTIFIFSISVGFFIIISLLAQLMLILRKSRKAYPLAVSHLIILVIVVVCFLVFGYDFLLAGPLAIINLIPVFAGFIFFIPIAFVVSSFGLVGFIILIPILLTLEIWKLIQIKKYCVK